MVSIVTATSLASGTLITGSTITLGAKIITKTLDNVLKLTSVDKNKHPGIHQVLVELDIESKLVIIHSMVKEIKKYKTSEMIDVCLCNLNEIVEKLSETLISIHNELDYHSTKWFSSWRTPNTENYLVVLNLESKILDKRLDLLVKCKSITQSLQPTSDNL